MSGGRRCVPTTVCSGATPRSRCSTRRASSPVAPSTSGARTCSSADDGTILSGQYRLMIRTEREKAQEKGKYKDVEFRRYTDDEIDAIDAQYVAQAESRRGAEPRFWEDVAESATRSVRWSRARSRVTDMVCWHVGMGMGLYGVRALDLAASESPAHPALLPPRRAERARRDAARALGPGVRPQVGEPHHVRLRAHARDLARSTSAPTGWATTRGSGSSTASSGASTTSATRNGCAGTVVEQVPRRRRPTRGRPRPAAPRANAASSPRPGHATILLPSREHGPVRLPDPPGGATEPRAGARARSAPMSSLRRGDRPRNLARRRRAAPAPEPSRQAQRAQRHDGGAR